MGNLVHTDTANNGEAVSLPSRMPCSSPCHSSGVPHGLKCRTYTRIWRETHYRRMHWSSSQETMLTIVCFATDKDRTPIIQRRLLSFAKGQPTARSRMRMAETVLSRFIPNAGNNKWETDALLKCRKPHHFGLLTDFFVPFPVFYSLLEGIHTHNRRT